MKILLLLQKIDFMQTRSEYITKIVGKKVSFIEAVLSMSSEGATVPFMARYRKERTGGMDEVEIDEILKSAAYFDALSERKTHILQTINEQGKLTAELKAKIEQSYDKTELEDLYLPFKPKKQTRAEKARKLGLEPLAKILMKQDTADFEASVRYHAKEISPEEATEGAIDIAAEWMSEHRGCRSKLRRLFLQDAVIVAKKVKSVDDEKAEKFKDYFDWEELVKKCQPHRFLALYRGEKEGVLKVKIKLEKDKAIETMQRFFLKNNFSTNDCIQNAIEESWKRLLEPGLQTETFQHFKDLADESSISVFSENLRQLLLAPPLGNKRVLAIDPGFRTGCKVVCLDEKGNLKHNETIFPHPPLKEKGKASSKIATLVDAYKIEAIAIGNGTAGRETEQFIKGIRFKEDLAVFVVNEDGASIYSASPIARKEFPSYDVTVRGAVSIGRRLMDPLAELVKIDPKSLGIGQYQHDVNQKWLKEALDRVVESAVNGVGVNVNTASEVLLSYVSGIGEGLAKKIVDHRKENGAFNSRADLLKVSGMGQKSYELSAGFLRVPEGTHPLDNSAVHPERYPLAEQIAKDTGVSLEELIGKTELINQVNSKNYLNDEIGMYTWKDLIEELKKPTRDIRSKVKVFQFDPNLRTFEDLKEGMIVPGIVTNITNFGAFVDVGIKENGLIHISQLKEGFVSNPAEVVKLNQQLEVKILQLDHQRKRVGCTLIF